MTKLEALNNIESIFQKVRETDDNIIKLSKSLKIVLLNLKIEDVKIKEKTGIYPIAKKLEDSISDIEEHLKSLIGDNRDLLLESINKLKEEIL